MPNPDITKDLTQGITISELAGGAIVRGKVGEEEVVVLQRGADVLAVGAHCTHYRGPLADGLIVGTGVKRDGVLGNPVDPRRVRRLVEAARGARS